MIRQLSATYPVRMLCDVLEVVRSTVYYEPVVQAVDADLVAAIESLLTSSDYCVSRFNKACGASELAEA